MRTFGSLTADIGRETLGPCILPPHSHLSWIVSVWECVPAVSLQRLRKRNKCPDSMSELEREGKGEPCGYLLLTLTLNRCTHLWSHDFWVSVPEQLCAPLRTEEKRVNYGPSNFKAAKFSESSNGPFLPITQGANILLPSVLNSDCHNCYIS